MATQKENKAPAPAPAPAPEAPTKADKLNAALAVAIKRQIGENKDHGWVTADSVAVLDELTAVDAEGDTSGKYSWSPELYDHAIRLGNASAFFAVLVKLGFLNQAPEGQRRGNRRAEMERILGKPTAA